MLTSTQFPLGRPYEQVCGDKKALESALQLALEKYQSHENTGDMSVKTLGSNRQDKRWRLRRQTLEQSGLWDEIELDEEIDLLEEEIAQLEEQKRLLSPVESSNDSTSDSQQSSNEDENENCNEEFNTPQILSTNGQISPANFRQRKQLVGKRERSAKRKRSKSSTLQISDLDFELQVTLSKTNFDCNYTTKKLKQSNETSHENFKAEEILKIRTVLGAEDEYIDILN